MKCRLCGEKITTFSQCANVEMDVNTLYRSKIQYPNNPMKVYWCESCKLAQIENRLDADYYEDYNLLNVEDTYLAAGGQAGRHEAYLKEVLRTMANALGEFKEKRLLDIGCGHGTIMEYAQSYFEQVEGVEASAVECEFAREKGLEVTCGYFDETWTKSGYTAVLSTQVWEHLERPRSLMKKVSEILKVGGWRTLMFQSCDTIMENITMYLRNTSIIGR
jgi:2-polyprenyl-3-methyl-5-hydroxy-6-metoxy-1,4-benzoquinol methylase